MHLLFEQVPLRFDLSSVLIEAVIVNVDSNMRVDNTRGVAVKGTFDDLLEVVPHELQAWQRGLRSAAAVVRGWQGAGLRLRLRARVRVRDKAMVRVKVRIVRVKVRVRVRTAMVRVRVKARVRVRARVGANLL